MTSYTYELSCTDCDFETTVEGDTGAALDVADDHQDEHGGGSLDHFVNCEIRGSSADSGVTDLTGPVVDGSATGADGSATGAEK